MSDTRKTETCARCGRAVEMTTSFSAPGHPPSPAICKRCLGGLTKLVRQAAKEPTHG